jgi:hypothetical protein
MQFRSPPPLPTQSSENPSVNSARLFRLPQMYFAGARIFCHCSEHRWILAPRSLQIRFELLIPQLRPPFPTSMGSLRDVSGSPGWPQLQRTQVFRARQLTDRCRASQFCAKRRGHLHCRLGKTDALDDGLESRIIAQAIEFRCRCKEHQLGVMLIHGF